MMTPECCDYKYKCMCEYIYIYVYNMCVCMYTSIYIHTHVLFLDLILSNRLHLPFHTVDYDPKFKGGNS